LRGKKILIWESELPEVQNHYMGSIPGRVLGKQNGKIEVLTGKGILRLSQLQYIDEEKKSAIHIETSVKDTFGR
jgi:methionyl-tRNA formyltransferase